MDFGEIGFDLLINADPDYLANHSIVVFWHSIKQGPEIPGG